VAGREIVADFVMSALGAFSRRPSEAPRYLPPVGLLLFTRKLPGLVPGDDDVGLLGRTFGPHGHPDRERFVGAHQAAEWEPIRRPKTCSMTVFARCRLSAHPTPKTLSLKSRSE